MNLRLGKSDGHELEERIRAKIGGREHHLIARLAVDVFAEWLAEQEAPTIKEFPALKKKCK